MRTHPVFPSRFAAVRALRLLPLCLALVSPALLAHDTGAGDVRIEHPFATPAAAGDGAAYLKRLRNVGKQGERLLGATTPVASRVELLAVGSDANAAPQMRPVAALDLAPGSDLQMRPGRGAQLRLVGLKQPLRDGDTFSLTLEFERAGRVEVKVYVQTPR